MDPSLGLTKKTHLHFPLEFRTSIGRKFLLSGVQTGLLIYIERSNLIEPRTLNIDHAILMIWFGAHGYLRYFEVGNTVDGINPGNHLGCLKPFQIMG